MIAASSGLPFSSSNSDNTFSRRFFNSLLEGETSSLCFVCRSRWRFLSSRRPAHYSYLFGEIFNSFKLCNNKRPTNDIGLTFFNEKLTELYVFWKGRDALINLELGVSLFKLSRHNQFVTSEVAPPLVQPSGNYRSCYFWAIFDEPCMGRWPNK